MTALQKPSLNTNYLERHFIIERSEVNNDNRTVSLAFASETPVERFFGVEVLECTPAAMRQARLNSGANLLMEHQCDDVVGVVESVTIGSDRVCRAVVRFGKSARAEEIYQDVLDGIRSNVSVGYVIHRAIVEENKQADDVYRIVDWEPVEISIVSIPADPTVGLGRSLDPKNSTSNLPFIERTIMNTTEDNATTQTAAAAAVASVVAATPAALAPVQNVQVTEAPNHARSIAAFAKAYPELNTLAMSAIQNGRSLEEFTKSAVELRSSGAVVTADLGLSQKELRNYSLARALNALANPQDAEAQRAAAFEHECSAETAKLLNRTAQGILVPYDIQKRDAANVGTPSKGGHTVATNLTSNYIDNLTDRLVVAQMGATVLDGLVGDLAIPRHLGGTTTEWIGESEESAESGPTWDQIPLTPKTISGHTDLSRKLIKQSSISMDSFIQNKLVKSIALGIQAAVINGQGTASTPQGILKALTDARIHKLGADGAKLTWKDIVALETLVSIENADEGTMGYLTNAKVRGLLKSTERFSTTNGQTIWGDGKELNGYQAFTTNAVPSNLSKGTGTNLSAVVFGNWAELVIGLWGGLDLIVDPFSKSKSGSVRFVAFQDVDFAYGHLESFSAIKDVVTE